MKNAWKHTALLVCVAAACLGQTRVDLRTQGKSVDFSTATSTRPVKTGAVMPATCTAGELFFDTSAPAGGNLYGCSATNTWTAQAGGSSTPDVTGNANKILTNDGSQMVWKAAAGDASGAVDALTVNRIRGRTVAATAPSNGQTLIWNSSSQQWEPAMPSGGSGGAQSFEDFKTIRASATTLQIGPACSSMAPCRVRLGAKTWSFTQPATVTLAGGTGMAHIFVSATGDLTAGLGGALTGSCVGCEISSDAEFPENSIPLATWAATQTAGAWDADGGVDLRSVLQRDVMTAGSGIVLVEDTQSGSRTVSLDTAVAMTKRSAQSGEAVYCAPTGATDDYTCSLTPAPSSYSAGMVVHLRANTGNTGAATLNVDGLGAKPIRRVDGAPLSDGSIVAGGHYLLLYDGTSFQLGGSEPPPAAFDARTLTLVDDFMANGSTSGNLHWTGATLSGAIGSAAQIPGEANHPGIQRVSTNGTAASSFAIYLRTTGGSPLPPLTGSGWEAQWIIRLNDLAQSVWTGLSDVGYSSSNRIEIRYENGTDTAFAFRLCATAVCSQATSGVTPAAGSWHKLRIRSTAAGQVLFSVDNQAETALTGNFPATNMAPYVSVSNQGAASAKSVDIDWFAFHMQGLSR